VERDEGNPIRGLRGRGGGRRREAAGIFGARRAATGEAGEREKKGGRASSPPRGALGGFVRRRGTAAARGAGGNGGGSGREAAAAWGKTPRVWAALIVGRGGAWACGPEAEGGWWCRVRPGLEPEPGSRSGLSPTGGGHPPARERGKGEGGTGGLGRGVWATFGGKKRGGEGKRAARWREGKKRLLAGPGCKGGKEKRRRERREGGRLGWAQRREERGKREKSKTNAFEFENEI
jgi:hypothetical protein